MAKIDAFRVIDIRITIHEIGAKVTLIRLSCRVLSSNMRSFDFRFVASISFLTVLVVSFSYFNVRLPSLRPFVSKYLVSDATSHQTRDSPRRSLLIIGKGRSGTSFVSKMFASADRVSKQHNKGNSSWRFSII